MATPAAQAFRPGDIRQRDGWDYQRQADGTWLRLRPTAGAAPTAPAGAPVLTPLGPPPVREPPPARPETVQGEVLRNERTRQEIEAAERAQRVTPQQQRFENESGMRREFARLPEVQNYQTVVPLYVAAREAADTRAGDLNLTYSFGKIMDPGSVVRESEQEMVIQTGPVADRLRAIMSEIDRRGRLSPQTRAQLIDELRTRRIEMARAYAQQRDQYIRMAREYGFNPRNIVGEHPAEPFAEQERAAAAAIASEPGVGGVPAAQALPSSPDIPPGGEGFQRELQEALVAGRFSTPDELIQFGRDRGFNIDARQAAEALRARERGQIAAVRTPRFETDISNMRGSPDDPASQDERDREGADALVRAGANALTLGGADYVAAGGNTLFSGGNFADNLRRERAITEYDQREHPTSVIAGSLIGGAALPTGAYNSARSAAVEALRAGLGREAAVNAARSGAARRLAMEGGAYGGIHGGLTSDGDIEERIATAAVETVFGGATGFGATRLAPRSAFGARPTAPTRAALVNPVTERVQAPLENALPAERVGAASAFGIDLPLGAAGGRTAAIIEKGLDIVPGSAGVMEDARAGLRGQVENAVEDVAGRYGTSQTLYTAGQAAQRGARNWIDRFEEVSGQAYDAIPIPAQRPAELTNTRAALTRMVDVFPSNPHLREMFTNSRLSAYLDALTTPHSPADELGDADPLAGIMRTASRTTQQQPGELSWDDLKHFRSIIGEEIGAERFSDSPARSQLRGLYAALSEDMRATAAAHGPRSLRRFERANNLYREGQERIDSALVTILGDDSRNNPEAAARAIQTIARSGRGTSNVNQLEQIRNSLRKNGEWDQVASTLIRLMGQPANSAGREFQAGTFVQTYADMSEQARRILFGGDGGGRRAELRESLDNFVAVMQRLAGTNALRNTSNTAPGITAAGTIGTITGALLDPTTGAGLLAGMGGAYSMGKLWTNPNFVRWATGYARDAARDVDPARRAALMAARREALTRLIRTEPTIAADLSGVEEQLFADDQDQR